MEKKVNPNIKSNLVTGASSTIGAAAGVVGGMFVSQEMNAAEVGNEAEVITPEPVPTPEPKPEPVPTPEPKPEPVPTPEPKPEPVPTPPGPGPEDEMEIEVVSYETIQDESGNLMDVAVISAEGQPIYVVDGDRDGIADAMASDLNSNQQFDPGEMVDLTGENISMQPLQDAANANNQLASLETGPDYINDANVDEYMA